MYRNIAVAALLIILAVVNWSIYQKEHQLASGKIVYLELAPVDPRSLIQGDYMALRFRLANEVYHALPKREDNIHVRRKVTASDGRVVAQLDKRNIATFKRIYDDQPLAQDEILLQYRVRNGQVKFATNAFFFQEGDAKYYQPARYGQFRVDDNGELLLVAMYDKELKQLAAEKKKF